MLYDIGAESVVDATVALEGDWSGGAEKGFINKVSGGTVKFSGSFNVILSAFYSGGVIGIFPNGKLTVREAIGIINKVRGQIGGVESALELVSEYDKVLSEIDGYTPPSDPGIMCTANKCMGWDLCSEATNCIINKCDVTVPPTSE